MSDKPTYDAAAAVENLRAQKARIRDLGDRMAAISGSSTSADRMVTATVDGQGRLVDLKLAGTRYRKLAPAELTTRIVETVRAAQAHAAQETASTLADLLPAELGLPRFGEKLDLDEMFESAIAGADRPFLTEKPLEADDV
jgi:DNA-binding protein YbaB